MEQIRLLKSKEILSRRRFWEKSKKIRKYKESNVKENYTSLGLLHNKHPGRSSLHQRSASFNTYYIHILHNLIHPSRSLSPSSSCGPSWQPQFSWASYHPLYMAKPSKCFYELEQIFCVQEWLISLLHQITSLSSTYSRWWRPVLWGFCTSLVLLLSI